MPLFNIIRDFFVQHVFGGYASDGTTFYGAKIRFFTNQNAYTGYVLQQPIINGQFLDDRNMLVTSSMTLGDWLSTTATIVSMIVIVLLICLFIKWIFKVVSGSIMLR